jgi:hypothetical protein
MDPTATAQFLVNVLFFHGCFSEALTDTYQLVKRQSLADNCSLHVRLEDKA